MATLADFVLEYTFTSKIHGLSGPISEDMVEYGMSRFKKDAAQTDESLAILGLVTFVKQKNQTLERYLTRDLNMSNPAHQGIVFEAFSAYLFAHAFSAPRPLSEVFKFFNRGMKANEALQDELAELVMLEKAGNEFQVTPPQIETNVQLSHLFGCSPSTAAHTLEWLKNLQGSTFCYPANTVSPDLIFVLRLTSNNTVLHVCVQFKHTEYLSPQALEKAIWTTDPHTFLLQKATKSNTTSCSNLPMQAQLEEAN